MISACYGNTAWATYMTWPHSSGQPIPHGHQVSEPVEAIHMPRQVTITKVPGHSKDNNGEAKGNNLAGAAAKNAALRRMACPIGECALHPANILPNILLQYQQTSTPGEKQIWQQEGAIENCDQALTENP